MPEENRDATLLIALLSGRAYPDETQTEADWERLIALAQQHTVAPMLYKRLKESSITPPQKVAGQLQVIFYASLKRNMRLFNEYNKILSALTKVQIPVVPLKGAYLAEAVYKSIALRPMTDIDLWVPRIHLDAARAVMQSLGYTHYPKLDRPQALQDALAGETVFYKPNAEIVELHWNIFPGEWIRHTTQIDEQVIWERTNPLKGELVRQLMPEDTIIHLCVHLAVNHQMTETGLRTLLDLDFARRVLDIDWETVVRRAHSWRVATACWLVLQSFARLFGDPDGQLPLAEIAPSKLRQSILNRFVPETRLLDRLRPGYQPNRFPFMLALVDRPADAVRLAWRAFYPDRLWLTLRYGLHEAPAWRIFIQTLWHPLRVLLKKEI
jgi:hypothetical protein